MNRNAILSLATVAVLCAAVAVPMAAEDVDEVEAFPALATFTIGLGIGFALGMYIGSMLADPSAGTLDAEVNDNYKELELKSVRSVIVTSNAMANAILPSDTDMLSFTSDHWNRVMEYSVANAWSLDGTYDPNRLMEGNLTQDSLSTYLYNWQHALDNSYNQIGAQQVLWDQYSIYADCAVALNYDGGTLWSRAPGEAGDRLDFLTAVTGTDGADKVYLRATGDIGAALTDTDDKYLYVFGPSSGTARLTTSLGLYMDLVPGIYDMSDLYLSNDTSLRSGTYTVSTSPGVVLAGAFSAAGKDAATVTGAMIAESGGSASLIRPVRDNFDVISSDGTVVTTADLSFGLTYTDRNSAVQTVAVSGDGSTSIGDVVRNWDGIQQKVSDLTDKAASAGQNLWSLYDLAETARDSEGNLVYLSPSSIIPDNHGIELSPEVQVAMSISALRQAGDYYAANATALDSMKIDISLNSANVVCYGDIWMNGILIAENAVYSPFTYERDLTLTAGTTVEMDQAGVALVYGYTDDLDSFLASPIEGVSMLPLSSGMSFTTERIIVDGADVETFSLTLDRVVEHTTIIPDGPGPVEPVELKDISQLFILIAVLLAAVLMLLGYATSNRILMVIGLVVGVIGVAVSDWTMRVYLGYEGAWDWLPWRF
ncbi:MAG: hypothetical protein EOM93_05380 [Gammaproteobacteria bacterium]|nr:hypothetical protein [Gammaproteobacteria bacterium]